MEGDWRLKLSARALVSEGVTASVGIAAEPAPGEVASAASHVGASSVTDGGRSARGAGLGELEECTTRGALSDKVIARHDLLVLLGAGGARVGVLTAVQAVGVRAGIAGNFAAVSERSNKATRLALGAPRELGDQAARGGSKAQLVELGGLLGSEALKVAEGDGDTASTREAANHGSQAQRVSICNASGQEGGHAARAARMSALLKSDQSRRSILLRVGIAEANGALLGVGSVLKGDRDSGRLEKRSESIGHV